METKDKIAQLGHTAPAIDSLKIPAYQWWSEALHGVAGSPGVHFGGNVSVMMTYTWNILYDREPTNQKYVMKEHVTMVPLN